jgi:uncharacterized LabA/DUF88 family protein
MPRVFKQRVAVLVDIQNMFYSARAHYNGKLNYDRLLDELSANRDLVYAVAYVVERPDVNQEGFYDALQRFGYTIRVKEAKNRQKDGKIVPVKGSYEVMLSSDAITLAHKVDTVVLVTGDGNYAYLARTLRALGVRVEVASFEHSTSKELLDEADGYVYISQDLVIEQKKRDKAPEIDDSELVGEDDEVEEEDFNAVQPASNASGLGMFS